jgi:DNA modification methylase
MIFIRKLLKPIRDLSNMTEQDKRKIADMWKFTDRLYREDCMKLMPSMSDGFVDLTITDIPYDGVNKESNGLRVIDKGVADILTFNINDFLEQVYRVTNGTIIIFCGHNQMSEIFSFFNEKQKEKKGTVRQLVWHKSNPSPMNGQHIYLSGTENAVWFKKRGGVFNAHCKSNVFKQPSGRSKLHPTEKNHKLLEELILDNSNPDNLVFDPCMGSGSHLFVAFNLGRQVVGCELNEDYYRVALNRSNDLLDK